MNKKLLIWLLVACILTILFAALGAIPLLSLNEGRRALVVKEMFQSGDWLVPRLNNTLYLTKPPFFYWVAMVFSWLAGQVNEWTLRLPSALSALGILIVLYRFALKQFGRRVAILAMIILVSNLEFSMFARRAEIEMLLTACCFGALWSAYIFSENAQSRWLYLSYGLLGLALLTKGPVCLLFVTLPLILLWMYTKKNVLKTFLLSISGWGLCLTIALSWYTVVTIQLGPDIWSQVIHRDMVEKVTGVGNTKPFLSYLGWIAVDYYLIVAAFFVQAKRSLAKYGSRADVQFLAFACFTPLIVFSLFSNKHAKYLLPVYPVIALLLALHLSTLYDAAGATLKKAMVFLALLIPVLVALFYLCVESRLFSYRVATFLPFRDWLNVLNVKEIYTLDPLDSRLVYYADKPLVPLNHAELSEKIRSGQSFILLSDSTQVSTLGDSSCLLKVFSPYLKKNRSLTVFGWGDYCDAPTDAKENKFTS